MGPPPELTISQWAEKYRYISPLCSSEPGKWHTNRTPYLREIMDVVVDPAVERIVVIKASRMGVTEVINNIIGYFIHIDPSPMLYVQQTLGEGKKYVDAILQPMIDETPMLRERVVEPRSGDTASTKMHKSFAGGNLTIVGADSPRGFRMVAKRIVILDDIDGFETNVGNEGDPVDLATKRADTFWNRKIFMASSPTIKDLSRIEAAFQESDKRYYEVPCPQCGQFQILNFFNLKWEKDKPEIVHYECAHCKHQIGQYQKKEMVQFGRWTATAPFKGTAGFHISQLYNPWVSWSVLASEFLKSKNNRERFMVFWNTKLGLSWEDRGANVSEDILAARRENYGPELPMGVGVLTCAVDVQGDRLELEVKGWGRYKESWGIEYRVIDGDPAKPEVWQILDEYLTSTWQHECGKDLSISCTAIDTGGLHTDSVYDFVKQRHSRHILAVKGANRPGQPIINPRKPSRKNRKGINLFMVGTDTAKAAIFARLKIEEHGPGYMHFPMYYDDEYFKQLTSETKKTKMANGVPVTIWVKKEGHRNEALDITVYNWAALKYLETFKDFNLEKIVERLNSYKTDENRSNTIMQALHSKKRRRILSHGIQP